MTFKIKTCACGESFTPLTSRQIHCSRRCINERNHNSPVWNDRQRDYKYKIYYGIGLEDYNKLFNKQDGRCAICNKHQTELKKKLHVDHSHEDGRVRGLLCSACNQALGLFKENVEILKRAGEYVS